MRTITRRDALKLVSAGTAAALHLSASVATPEPHADVPIWEVFELTLEGPSSGNPFADIQLTAKFSLGHRTITVDGFYDGSGTYRIRFMPDVEGVWSYSTISNAPVLNGEQGTFKSIALLPGAHGPVRVHNTHHFAYSDGTPFFPFGTTCYAWIHQADTLQQETLATLRNSPFNKIRMCVFPKSYEYNHNEPALYPFERDAAGTSDFTRPNPAFFAHVEQRIADLRALNIEADLILFHPYDRWGYATMPPEADDGYLRYMIARLSAYRNIWWSLANEYDLMRAKSAQDFDRFFHIVEESDPCAHLRSVHYSVKMYDYGHPWVTHASLQTSDFAAAPGYLAAWKKPVCYDEVQYEGNLNKRWGNLPGSEMTRKFWLGVIAGCYVTHGETYLDPAQDFDEGATPMLWWSHGGKLHGSSPRQIGFLRKLLEDAGMQTTDVRLMTNSGLEASPNAYYLNATAYKTGTKDAQTVLYYFDFHQPIWYEFLLPEGNFTAEWIDPLTMTIRPLQGRFTGKAKLRLSGLPFQALRFRAIE